MKIEPGKYGFPVEFKKRYANYISGEWVAPAAGRYFDNVTHAPALVALEEDFFEDALGSDATFETSIFNAGPTTVTALPSGDGFVAQGEWTAFGRVGHWGHMHNRINKYKANMTVEPVEGAWKRRRRRLFATTDTEERAMAMPASTGDSVMPHNGYSTPAATGIRSRL